MQPAKVFLSEHETIQCKEAFSLFDKHGSGKIPTVELGNLMRVVGRNPTAQDLEGLLEVADPETTGSVSFESFIKVLSNSGPPVDCTAELLEAFQYFDKGGAGVISASQLQDILTNSEEKFSDVEIEDLLKQVDEANTGVVKYGDIAQVWTLL